MAAIVLISLVGLLAAVRIPVKIARVDATETGERG